MIIHYAVPPALFFALLKTIGQLKWEDVNGLMAQLQLCQKIESNDNPRPTSADPAGPGRASAASPPGDESSTDECAGPAADGA